MEQKEQFWLHESMINSLLYDAQKTLHGKGFDVKLDQLAFEVRHHYGNDADCSGVITFPFEKDAQPITISNTTGLIIGDKAEGGLRTNIAVFC